MNKNKLYFRIHLSILPFYSSFSIRVVKTFEKLNLIVFWYFCQNSVKVLRREVDFMLLLSQEEEEQPPLSCFDQTLSLNEFDTEDPCLVFQCVVISCCSFWIQNGHWAIFGCSDISKTVLGVFEKNKNLNVFKKRPKTVLLISEQPNIAQWPFCIQNER